ncbi:unnamed protein product (macronuclear) [Paramecium tetraurelia]|uniref:Protein kinase domain-containing protein n=1 Tax=Paramecium tetraurelia TaxID=5888 RepID=A0E1T8_PARTE|nr:uncharacterized protein GSPATT00022426001 [Paramecium tetraurelia]CAK89255.1 unnamed protein product [Paramecium tetraurelia]|eukprot:XP_001456652.1 hypothetical protein (macronuclear) [Paramecium tetraurelia strain d4-2]
MFNNIRKHKENIRNELRTHLFGKQGLRIRRSVDIENVIVQQEQVQSAVRFKDAYVLQEQIGEGAHSVVRKCYKIPKQRSTKSLMPKSIQVFAVKCFRTDDPEIVNTIIQTFNLQRQLHDIPYVCRTYDLFIDQQTKHHYQVIEYCDTPNLEQVYRSLTLRQKQDTIKQLAQIIAQIHARGISHRDLKPENILIQTEPNLQIKLIDFGVSKRFKYRDAFTEMWTATGTILYQAPEVFLGGGYDEKVDIWSIGIILYQLLCSTLPFYAETISETIEQITSPDPQFQYSKEFLKLNPIQRDLIKRLLKLHPHQRLSAEEIPLHPWFEQENYVDVSSDDMILAQDMMIGERTMSNQIGTEITEQQFQNLMDSLEWGRRIHFIQ